jgi:flagellar motor switch/type III secretory pathway protein FliN
MRPIQSFSALSGIISALHSPRMEAPTPQKEPEMGALSSGSPSPGAQNPSEGALVPAARPRDHEDGLQLNPRLAQLAVELDVAIPVRDFRVRNLLVLEPGQVIQTQWQQGEDMPLAARGTQLAWSEFEVVDSRLAVRVTRLA